MPHLPPTSILSTSILGAYYYHCETEYWDNGPENDGYCNSSVYEDPDCSDSLGPAYSFADHKNYLNVQYGNCSVALFATIPGSINQGIGNIPPLPELATDFLAATGDSLFNSIGIKT